jgi:hypothetical protein
MDGFGGFKLGQSMVNQNGNPRAFGCDRACEDHLSAVGHVYAPLGVRVNVAAHTYTGSPKV